MWQQYKEWMNWQNTKRKKKKKVIFFSLVFYLFITTKITIKTKHFSLYMFSKIHNLKSRIENKEPNQTTKIEKGKKWKKKKRIL